MNDTQKEFLTGREEQFCDWCLHIAGYWNRRGNLMREGKPELAMRLDIPLKVMIGDFKGWMLKNE